ncbi:hypothetical protein KC367_g8886 [Hortaea werneckii]|nr:hypothetical protein KC367_g8886 [Hortaea werneckii]
MVNADDQLNDEVNDRVHDEECDDRYNTEADDRFKYHEADGRSHDEENDNEEMIKLRYSRRRELPYDTSYCLPPAQEEKRWDHFIHRLWSTNTYEEADAIYFQIVDSFHIEAAENAVQILRPLSQAFDKLSAALSNYYMDPFHEKDEPVRLQAKEWAKSEEDFCEQMLRCSCGLQLPAIKALQNLNADFQEFHMSNQIQPRLAETIRQQEQDEQLSDRNSQQMAENEPGDLEQYEEEHSEHSVQDPAAGSDERM